jgi:hypothetical protein
MASVCAWLGTGATLPLFLIGLPILGGLIVWLLKSISWRSSFLCSSLVLPTCFSASRCISAAGW